MPKMLNIAWDPASNEPTGLLLLPRTFDVLPSVNVGGERGKSLVEGRKSIPAALPEH